MAKKLNDDHIKWILSLDAKGVQGELKTLSSRSQELARETVKLEFYLAKSNKRMQDAQKQLDKLTVAGDTTSLKFKEVTNNFHTASKQSQILSDKIKANRLEVDLCNKKTDAFIKTLKLEDMTMAQLTKKAKDLQRQLNNTSKSAEPKAYEALRGELKGVNSRMKDLKKGSEDAEKTFSPLSSGALKAFTLIGIGIVAVNKGFETYRDLMLTNKATGVEFKASMDGLNNSFDYFKTALANLDFTNFITNMRAAYKIGREVSISLDELFERQNSFKLTSAPVKAEIEDLKTQLRDVNLTNQQRLAIGEQIISKTKELAAAEKDIAKQKVIAMNKLLQSQTQLNDSESDYVITNYNKNRDSIIAAKELIELENKVQLSRKSGGDRDATVRAASASRIKTLTMEIDLVKQSANYSETAYTALKKYTQANNDLVSGYVNAQEEMLQVDINTNRELRRSQTMINSLTKQEQGPKKQKSAQNILLEDIETKHQDKLAEIKRKYRDGEITSEAEYNRKSFAQEQSYLLLKEEVLAEFIKNTTDKELKSDLSNKLADVQNKRLDQEIKFRADLEKIILDANPIAKEKRAYQEKLQALDLLDAESGEARKDLTATQLEALELLEKEHQDNMVQIRKSEANKAKAKSEEDFEADFKTKKEEMQTELNELIARSAELGGSSFDAEMAVHVQRMAMINAEMEARTKAGLSNEKQILQSGRAEANMTKTVRKELEDRTNQLKQYGATMGSVMGNVLSGQEDALQGFADASIDILFDVLSQIIDAELTKVIATATGAIARSTAEAMAQPDSVASFGATGFARVAILTGAISAAMAVAKTALKGLIGGGKKKTAADSTGGKGQRVTSSSGLYDGGYNDIGSNGGYTGHGGRYEVAGVLSNGVSIHRGEYVVPTPELHVPAVASMVRSIESIRRQRTSSNPIPDGLADGGYNDTGSYAPVYSDKLEQTIDKLGTTLDRMQRDGVGVNYYKFENARKTVDRANKGASKKG